MEERGDGSIRSPSARGHQRVSPRFYKAFISAATRSPASSVPTRTVAVRQGDFDALTQRDQVDRRAAYI
jgi:hypothetical protein